MYINKPLLKYHQTAHERNYYIVCVSTVTIQPPGHHFFAVFDVVLSSEMHQVITFHE